MDHLVAAVSGRCLSGSSPSAGAPSWPPPHEDDPIVTSIEPLAPFYVAEDYHQDYFANNPDQGYCVAVVGPKVKKFKALFADKLKSAH